MSTAWRRINELHPRNKGPISIFFLFLRPLNDSFEQFNTFEHKESDMLKSHQHQHLWLVALFAETEIGRKDPYSPEPVFYLWLSKVSANERSFYICQVFSHSHRLSPSSAIDKNWPRSHYSDVIMGAMASQITNLTIVYSTVFFRRRSKKTSKFRVTGLCAGNSPVISEVPAQMASNAENVSIWWRHHATYTFGCIMTTTRWPGYNYCPHNGCQS